MSDRDNELLNVAPADVPDGQGGGGGNKAAVTEPEDLNQKPVPVDPPDGDGGGTQP